MAKFLETITALDNAVLIPIDRIKAIVFRCETEKNYIIEITTSDDYEFEEFFTSEDMAISRIDEIKQIVEAE